MFESEKIITVQNIEFIGEYLYQRGKKLSASNNHK